EAREPGREVRVRFQVEAGGRAPLDGRPDGDVDDREAPEDPLLALELRVEDGSEAIPILGRALDAGVIRGLLQHRLQDLLEGDRIDARLEVARVPEEPAHHLRLAARVARDQAALAVFRPDMEEDRRRLPDDKAVVLEGRYLAIRVLGEVLRRRPLAIH